MKNYRKYCGTAILGLIAIWILVIDQTKWSALPIKLNPHRAPASTDDLDENTRQKAEQIRDYFLPHSYRTEEMIQIALEHITPGESHDADEIENPAETSLRGAVHRGISHRYTSGSPRCLQAVNDAAVESGQYTDRIETISACFAYDLLNSRYQNLLIDQRTAGMYLERQWNNKVRDKNWRYLLSDPRMAPRGAILLYNPASSIGQCAHVNGRRGHIEIKTADAGSHGYVSVSQSNRPAYGLPRTLIGIYVKMPEFDFEDVDQETDALLEEDIDVNFNQSDLGQGEDILYGGSPYLNFKRKDCLREARAILFYTKRAHKRLKRRIDRGNYAFGTSTQKIKTDIRTAYEKTVYYREEDTTRGPIGDNRTWGIDGCAEFPYEHRLSIQTKLSEIRNLLRNFSIEDHQYDILDLMGEVIGRDSDGEATEEPSPIKAYYEHIRANRNGHLNN